MSRMKSRQSTAPIAASPTSDDSDPSFEGIDSEESLEKDETELELEKLVFGDEAGFQEGLGAYKRKFRTIVREGVEEDQRGVEQLDELGEGIEGVDDADLFFLDSGPSVVAPELGLIQGQPSVDGDDQAGGKGGPAWVDSDDERIMVSLASHARLRKLRITESEDLINGTEYTKRLRRQFERLYPVPDWANPSTIVKCKKRRRSNASDSSGGDGSADNMSTDSNDLSVQPLAELLQNATDLIKTTSTSSSGRKRLRPEVIDIQRTKDVGLAQPSSITSLTFHPLHPLLLSSGPASTLFLHHISPHPPNPNPLLTSLHLRSTPLSTSAFLPPDGAKIFFSGRRRYFHTWNLSSGKIDKVSRVYGHGDEQRTMERFKLSPCGRWMGLVGSGRKGGGMVNVLDARTCQWVAEVRVEGRGGVADFAWWGDGEGMVILGKGGEAVEWDGREKRTVGRWMDEGAVGTTVVALGGTGRGLKALGGDRWLAVGSASGVVNVYDRASWGASKGTDEDELVPPTPKPKRAFDHLTTPTSHLEFSPDGQLLVMASQWKRDALRLVHLPSCTVYRNWPTSSTPLGRITALAFSPLSSSSTTTTTTTSSSDSGSDPDLMLAVANEQGKIRLWEIRN